jgi:hypothetical protein
VRLKSTAFLWDPRTDNPQGKECSVFEDVKLERAGLVRRVVLDVPSWEIAGIEADDLRKLKRDTAPEQPSPFYAVEAPWPNGKPGRPRDVAHANIVHDVPKVSDKWYQKLALSFPPIQFER